MVLLKYEVVIVYCNKPNINETSRVPKGFAILVHVSGHEQRYFSPAFADNKYREDFNCLELF